ncbi:MAG: hypothetical protein ACQETH_03385 [Candidatus Rifleibacteriota bacterium]
MNEVATPEWVHYVGDGIFLLLFLVVLFFFKADPESLEPENEAEQPNPLEKVLVTETTEIDEEQKLEDAKNESPG